MLASQAGHQTKQGELKALLKLSPDASIGYGIRAGSAIRVDPDGTVAPMGRIDQFVKQGGVVRRAKNR